MSGSSHRRREFLTAIAAPLVSRYSFAQKVPIDEFDPSNTKLAHRLDARGITDDDMLFLQQIGMRWARVEFGAEPAPFDTIDALKQRFAKYGIRIYSGVHA